MLNADAPNPRPMRLAFRLQPKTKFFIKELFNEEFFNAYMAQDGTLRITEAHYIANGTNFLQPLVVWHTIDLSSGITTASVTNTPGNKQRVQVIICTVQHHIVSSAC